jgi:hypothetical protein
MKVHAPEGYHASMKRTDAPQGHARWAVFVKRDGKGNGGYQPIGGVTAIIGTTYREIKREAEKIVLDYCKHQGEYNVCGQWFQSEKEAAEYAETVSRAIDVLITVRFQGVEPVSEYKGGMRYTRNV